jgi:RND family efflux transporter MFP subunit
MIPKSNRELNRGMYRKRVWLPIVLSSLCSLVAIGLVRYGPRVAPLDVEPYKPVVTLRQVELAPKTLYVASQGSVRASIRMPLASQLDGLVSEVTDIFIEGGFFRKGEMLVRIDDTDYRTQEAEARSRCVSARLHLKTLEGEAELALKDWNEMSRFIEGEPSPLLFREPQMEDALAKLMAAEASLQKAQQDLKRTEIRAPFDGRILNTSVDLGQFIRRGQELAVVFDTSRVEVSLPIPLGDLMFLDDAVRAQTPDSVPFSIPVELSGQFGDAAYSWMGHIHRVAGEIDTRSRMVSLIAEVVDPYRMVDKEAGGHAALQLGMFVTARIEGVHLPAAFSLPRSAILPDGRLMTVDEDNRIRLRQVDVLTFENESAIIVNGLVNGDRVCITRLETPMEGSEVRLAEAVDGGMP